MNKFLFVVTLLVVSMPAVFAQEPTRASTSKLSEMSVDMPDETQETDLVEKGEWQVGSFPAYHIQRRQEFLYWPGAFQVWSFQAP